MNKLEFCKKHNRYIDIKSLIKSRFYRFYNFSSEDQMLEYIKRAYELFPEFFEENRKVNDLDKLDLTFVSESRPSIGDGYHYVDNLLIYIMLVCEMGSKHEELILDIIDYLISIGYSFEHFDNFVLKFGEFKDNFYKEEKDRRDSAEKIQEEKIEHDKDWWTKFINIVWKK